MCGIFGVFGKSGFSVEQHLKLLDHRGPDHNEAVAIKQTILGHTRLSIVDVDGGDQPLHSTDSRYHLISNGEIYNHEDIRQQLADYPFQTDSDSEAILAAYEHYGPDAIYHLDGMFAFALYDQQENTIFLARDPIGIKPLYYGWQGDTLYFASEIKSLHDLVDELHEFPPGHYYYQGEFVRYYDLHQLPTHSDAVTAPSIADIRQSLTEAVHKRLMSDVPLGVYLSGGLDSTIVASIVAQVKPDVHSFAVGIEGSQDIENARQAAKTLATQHHEYIYTADEIREALPNVIYYLESFDPSLVRSAIPNYFLARMTRQHVVVVLTGEGADELYAGYHYLKEVDEDHLGDELVELIATLYNCNLQRCDRMTMAHSIEARVPFLDTDFIKLSLQVSKAYKIHPQTQVEKWALREAFADILPENVTWRKKEQFSHGAGSNHLLVDMAEAQYSDTDYLIKKGAIYHQTGIDITSKEMLMYYDIFDGFFSDKAKSLVKLWRGHDVA
ncbi:MAG: asparagine synthase B [Anaerolineaceae bacterium]|nr:asparagine synthase B [Anaerolineaceae bacterium]